MTRRWPFLVAGLVLVAYLATGVAQVQPGERVVVRRFGRVVAKPGPGLWVGLPWGIDRVDRVPIDLVKSVTVGFQPGSDEGPFTPSGQLVTGDHNLVNVQVVLDYAVREDEVEAFVLHAERVDGVVARAAESVLADWVAGRGVDDVLLNGKGHLPPALVRRVQERIEPYGLGIQLQAASVAYLLPPDDVRHAFDEVTRAQAAIRTREQEARQVAERRKWEAETERVRLEQTTAAYAYERIELARAEAETFVKRLEQYHRLRQSNPDVLSAIWWDEMGRLLARMKENGRIDLLDNHLGADGLDITHFAPRPGKR
jgi:modulator of FtsH protease HflK